MTYSNHLDIPAKYRRIVLQETGEKVISNLSLSRVADIIAEYEERERKLSEYNNFKVYVEKEGKITHSEYDDIEKALVQLDVAVGPFEQDSSVTAWLQQGSSRIIRAFINGRWIEV